MAILHGIEVAKTPKQGQVYQATHVGEKYLPYMNRSFISFTYGGKHIEEFNLISTFSDRMKKSGYATFDDNTTTYNNLEGQQYWATHYRTNTLDFTLSTDGMTQQQLDEFLQWFHAGEAKELILAEHPNRAILARVSSPPELNLLPFEEPVTININSYIYNTKTTLYKGDINLSLVADTPHWYSLLNILGIKSNNKYIDKWKDANGTNVSVFESEDALKILYEDGIPLGSMIQDNMLLGNGAFANVKDNINAMIWDISATEQIPNVDGLAGAGACIDDGLTTGKIYIGQIQGAVIEAGANGIHTLSPHVGDDENIGYFFYSGTAPAPTEISFSIIPGRSDTDYINAPSNSYSKNPNSNNAYDVLTIESIHKQELRFTTPNLYTSFNKVIKIFKDNVKSNSTLAWSEIIELLIDVRHTYVRQWASKVISDLDSDKTPANTDVATIINSMWDFLKDANNNIQPVTFTFNSETGLATGKFKFRVKSSNSNGYTIKTMTEDVGDMLQSNYIIIRDRNYPDSEYGSVLKWDTNKKTNSHRIYHNSPAIMSSLSVLYKNMYL